MVAAATLFFSPNPSAIEQAGERETAEQTIQMVEIQIFSTDLPNHSSVQVSVKSSENILDQAVLERGSFIPGKMLSLHRNTVLVKRGMDYSYEWVITLSLNMQGLKDGRYRLEFACRPRRAKVYPDGTSEYVDPSVSAFELIKSGNRIGVASRYDIG